MPVWYPPTPPQDESDIYIDASLSYLYDWNIMPESQLPPVYVKRDNKRPRADTHSPDSRRPSKSHRREEAIYTPRSLFERPAPDFRRDMKLHKYRNMVRTTIPGVKPTTKITTDTDPVLEWTLSEDKCILDAVKSQNLPLNLMILTPALTPNWELVADLVNNTSRIYRSPRQCKNRYENVILPREEGKSLIDVNQKKQKKSKSSHKSSRLMRTSHLYEQDNNASFTKDIISRHDVMRVVLNKKTTTPKRRYDDSNIKSLKYVAVLNECGINYEKPANPMEIAAKRAERIAKEKQKNTTPAPAVAQTEQVVAPSRLQNITKVTSSPPLATSSPTHGNAPASSPRPAQRVLQADQLQRQQRIVVAPQGTSTVVKANAAGALTAGGKPLNQAQIQYYRSQTGLRHQQLKVYQQVTPGGQPNNIVQQIGVAQQGVANKISPITVTSIQVSTTQQRPQITQATGTVGKQTIGARAVEVDFNALIKRQALVQQKNVQQPVTQIFTSQQQLQSLQAGTSERVAVTVAGTTAVAVATGNVASPTSKIAGAGTLTGVATTIPGKTSMKMATQQQLRQLQLQQQLTLVQRKGQKFTQLAQVGGGAQVIVQTQGGTHKTLPPGMTMQQLQQVMRQIPPTGARVLPRQTIQVVGGNVGQVRAGTTGHQVILSQVSAALQARQPTPLSTSSSATVIRPVLHPQTPPDPQPKT